MEKLPADLDLKMMPDWLKEAPAKNPYADYEVREERPRRDFGERPRPPRDRKPKSHDEKRGPKREHGRDFKKPHGAHKPPQKETPRPQQPREPAPVRIEFFPEMIFVNSVAKQVKSTNRAYPLFDLARMFLEKPERHRVRVSAADEKTVFFRLGDDGPVAMDRATLEKSAFNEMAAEFYTVETTQREPLKGNFTNVARCKLTGTLLGPTNYHGYQPALRKLYEERFSRRMPFPEFQREIEVVTDPAVVDAWKEEARSVTVYKTLKEPEQLTLDANEAEQHFRKTYLDSLIRTGTSFDLAGETSRHLPDRRIASAVREAWENQRGFPGQMLYHLRQQLTNLGLHVFKHHKRMQFVSAVRPEPFTDKNFSANIAEILRVISANPKCTRADLTKEILGAKESDPDLPKLKTALAADLHWLIDAGRVIEFQDGRLALPLEPRAADEALKPAAPTSPAQSSSESEAP